MKVLRRVFCLLVLVIFFFFGIGVADRQRLNRSVVGICIRADSEDTINGICDYLSVLYYKDEAELCCLINESGLGTAKQLGKTYFEKGTYEGGIVPAGVYDTVYIETNKNRDSRVYKTLMGGKIEVSHKTALSQLQNAYVAVLSFAGNVERFILELQQ